MQTTVIQTIVIQMTRLEINGTNLTSIQLFCVLPPSALGNVPGPCFAKATGIYTLLIDVAGR
jgi:hypothetical protein